MKVRAINFDDAEQPETVVVEMTTNEAALFYAFVGHISPKRVTDAAGDVKWGNALYDAADCLSGAFFNVLWDSGWDEVGPRTLRVATLQGEEPEAVPSGGTS